MPKRLDVPSGARTRNFRIDAESFGTWSESFARYLGTSKFILQMTVFIALWLGWNTLASGSLRFDKYPFQFLTLLLSLQASYAAPLILLAQNRQDDRDRIELRSDRAREAVNHETDKFIVGELIDLRSRLNELTVEVNRGLQGLHLTADRNTENTARILGLLADLPGQTN